MTRIWTLWITLIAALGLTATAMAAEKIDGYEVVSADDSGVSQEVTDLESGLGKLVDVGPLELGAAEEDHLVLHLWFRLLDSVPVSGKVHKIRFENLQLNDVQFSIPQFDAFEIPSTPPYEIDDPLVVKAAYEDIAIGMLREMLTTDYAFHVTGRMLVFGKFKLNRRNKKYVIPVDINIELSSESLAESEYRDAVADQIFEILKSDLLDNLESWRQQIGPEEGATEDPATEEPPAEEPAPAE
jgi:hypothetical protein